MIKDERHFSTKRSNGPEPVEGRGDANTLIITREAIS
jgi:hypothetical protein